MTQENDPKRHQPKEAPPERKAPVREADTPIRKSFDVPSKPRVESDEPWPRPRK